MPVATKTEINTISNLEGIIDGLPPEERELVRRFYWVNTTIGRQKIPETMREWAEKQFNTSAAALEHQKIVRVRNEWTREEALFNEFRARRPVTSDGCPASIMETILRTDNCLFCTPEERTPEDLSGRVHGEYAVTGSNIAKYDAHHGLVIPFSHNPFEFSAEKMRDYLKVALQWLRQEHAISKEMKEDAACPYIMANVLWKAGATVIHLHLQMTLSTGGNYPDVEKQKAAEDAYSGRGRQDNKKYFDDLFRAHEALGLGFRKHGSMMLAELTPKKEKGVMIIRDMPYWDEFQNIADSVDFVIQRYLEMGVQSFNMSFYLPSMTRDNGWCRFPSIVRFIDRGPLDKNNSDMAGMELAGIPVISTDPYKLMSELVKNN